MDEWTYKQIKSLEDKIEEVDTKLNWIATKLFEKKVIEEPKLEDTDAIKKSEPDKK